LPWIVTAADSRNLIDYVLMLIQLVNRSKE
jgi:hypothetical protein